MEALETFLHCLYYCLVAIATCYFTLLLGHLGSGCLLVSHLMSTLVSYVSYNFNHSLCICIMVLLIILYFWEFSSDILIKSIAAVSTENRAVDPLPSLQVLHHHVSSMERLSLTTRATPSSLRPRPSNSYISLSLERVTVLTSWQPSRCLHNPVSGEVGEGGGRKERRGRERNKGGEGGRREGEGGRGRVEENLVP